MTRKDRERARKRMSRGWSAEDAASVPRGTKRPRGTPITVDGKTYPSLRACGRAYSVSHLTVARWRDKGREFAPRVNISALAREAGKLPSTVLRRVRGGMPLERALRLRVIVRRS